MTDYQQQFWENIEHFRNARAVVSDRGEITYGEIERLFLQLHETLPADEHFAFWASRTPESAIFTLFCMVTGRSFTPISLKVPSESVSSYIKQLGVRVITDPVMLINECKIGDLPTPDRTAPNLRTFASDETQYVLFTSGSTGTPKGVPVSFGNLDAYYRNARGILCPTSEDVFSQTFDHSFDLSIHDILLAGTSFASLVILTLDALKDPVQAIGKCGITIWFSVPSLIPLFKGSPKSQALNSLRVAMFCGEKFYTEQAQHLANLGIACIQNWFGPTEATIACSYHQFDGSETQETLPIGKPFRGTDFSISEESDEAELLISGDQVFKNYLTPNDRAFKQVGETRYYRSGDVVSIVQDDIFIVGRNNAMVKVRGYRVDLNEIENAAAKIMPNYNLAATPANNGSAIVLFLEADEAHEEAEVLEKIAPLLPEYAVPTKLVCLRAFPRTISGKINRKELAALVQAESATHSLLDRVNQSKKVSHLGLDSIDLMKLFLEIEEQIGSYLNFDQIEMYLDLSVAEILTRSTKGTPLPEPTRNILRKKDVLLNSRCRRYATIYHHFKRLTSPETKILAVGTSGLFRALGEFSADYRHVQNYCTPGMSLQAIAKLSRAMQEMPSSDYTVLFEIDPVMLTSDRPKGDFEIENDRVPRPPLMNLRRGEYDYDKDTNGFSAPVKSTPIKQMKWVMQREKIVEACYLDPTRWDSQQIHHARESYHALLAKFRDVRVFIHPLRKPGLMSKVKPAVKSLLEDRSKEPSVVLHVMDEAILDRNDFADFNHLNRSGASKFKAGLAVYGK